VTKNSPSILVIEDEPQMRRFLRASLTSHGFEFVEAASAAEAMTLATAATPDVVLLDLGLPDEDGVTLTRRFREWSRVPIIVISARGREADKVEVLDAGADDYLTKPFGVDELLARIRVALRHATQAGVGLSQVVEVGPLRIDFQRREVRCDDREIHLTPTEYRIVALLAQNAGKVLTHGHILSEVWGQGLKDQAHYLRVYMAQLRRKIEADPARPRLFVTEPGVGYRLKDRV
jgi:two-component system, OmpR family, KDP operon response regulator KdpE